MNCVPKNASIRLSKTGSDGDKSELVDTHVLAEAVGLVEANTATLVAVGTILDVAVVEECRTALVTLRRHRAASAGVQCGAVATAGDTIHLFHTVRQIRIYSARHMYAELPRPLIYSHVDLALSRPVVGDRPDGRPGTTSRGSVVEVDDVQTVRVVVVALEAHRLARTRRLCVDTHVEAAPAVVANQTERLRRASIDVVHCTTRGVGSGGKVKIAVEK